jgi:hypothetical protein
MLIKSFELNPHRWGIAAEYDQREASSKGRRSKATSASR